MDAQAFDLIRVFAVVSGDVKLALGGDGDVNEASELARQLGISERVQLLGWVTGENKEALLSTASIFVLPSYNEGLPMSVLEAMAWGGAGDYHPGRRYSRGGAAG